MKTAKAGLVNYLSFIRTIDITINDFDLVLKSTVGNKIYNFNNLQDLYNLVGCRDFFVLTLNLITTQVIGGEYTLELYNNNIFRGSYLINVIGYEYDETGNGAYKSVVSVNDL
jgi:hypothetical protein